MNRVHRSLSSSALYMWQSTKCNRSSMSSGRGVIPSKLKTRTSTFVMKSCNASRVFQSSALVNQQLWTSMLTSTYLRSFKVTSPSSDWLYKLYQSLQWDIALRERSKLLSTLREWLPTKSTWFCSISLSLKMPNSTKNPYSTSLTLLLRTNHPLKKCFSRTTKTFSIWFNNLASACSFSQPW